MSFYQKLPMAVSTEEFLKRSNKWAKETNSKIEVIVEKEGLYYYLPQNLEKPKPSKKRRTV